jgi:hypothetical protein
LLMHCYNFLAFHNLYSLITTFICPTFGGVAEEVGGGIPACWLLVTRIVV